MSIGEKASSSASSQSVEAATGAAPVDKKAAAAAARAARPAVPLFSYVLPLVLAAAHAYFLWHVWVTEFRGRLPAVSSATAVVAVPIAGTAAYVLSVLLGRRWMLSPGAVAWDVRPFQHVYNVYITALSLTMLVLLGRETLWPALATGGPLWLSKLDATTGGAPLAFALWLNYHSKYLEYADTLFIILSRKSDQLSFLHVEHHAVMVPVMYFVFAFCPGGQSYFAPACNAFIHTVMYAYFTASSFGINLRMVRQYLTSLQLAQFVIIMAHAVFHLLHRNPPYWPMSTVIIELLLMVNMLVLFGNFFYQQYFAKKDKGAKSA